MNRARPQHRFASRAGAAALARLQVDSYRRAYRGLLPDAYLDQLSYAEQQADWEAVLPPPAGETVLLATDAAGVPLGYAMARAQRRCR